MHSLMRSNAATRGLGSLLFALAALSALGCGGAEKEPNTAATDTSAATTEVPEPAPSPEEEEAKAKSALCKGLDLDLSAALIQAACEVPEGQATPTRDLKGVLDVRVAASPTKVEPGGHLDVVVTYKNMKKEPLQLDFMLDPTPRFSVEAYDAKGTKRVDMPPGREPAPPKGAAEKVPSPPSTARVTIGPGGTAHVRVGWDAVRTKWDPKQYNGTPIEMGFPRAPNGPLAKGKYQLRVVTPLINVEEGFEKEVSVPRVDVEVGR